MPRIERIIVGKLHTNCYVLHDNGECAIIDPGDEFGSIDRFISSNKLTPVCVIATHGHFDHVLAAPEFFSKYGLKLMINESDAGMLGEAAGMARLFTGQEFRSEIPNEEFRDGHVFKIGNCRVTAKQYPGHTPGSTILEAGNETLLTGDTLFRGSIGRVDFGGSLESMRASLKKLKGLDKDYVILPGHGESTSLKEEKESNPFLSDNFTGS
jgi:glyoxylase-like metal-dependent hydrolase (beta-lactamase superfamily II)